MCKHVLNAQVSIRAPCCKKWFDCAQCHEEQAGHPLRKSEEMVLACKKCKKVFRKDTREFDEADEYCPRCDNHFVIEAKSAPTPAQKVAAVAVLEGGLEMQDPRVKQTQPLNVILSNSNLGPS